MLNINGGKGSGAAAVNGSASSYQFGLMCVAAASMLSGLSGALIQRALAGAGSGAAAQVQRNTMLFSAEMAVYGIVFLLVNLLFNNDTSGSGGGSGSLLSHWDLPTFIPVITNVRIADCLEC